MVAIVDPATSRAESVLEQKRNSFVVSAYEKTRICKTIEDFHSSMNPDGSEIPHAVIIGSPPAYHGSDQPGRDMELKLIQLFPKVALFIEKPISTDSVQNALSVARQLEGVGKTTVCTVGYMLRYLKGERGLDFRFKGGYCGLLKSDRGSLVAGSRTEDEGDH